MTGDGVTTIREVSVRYARPRKIADSDVISAPVVAARFVCKLIGQEAREHFLALFLDGRKRAIGYQVISVGTATASLVHPREVFQAAIALGACSLILAHNHPSGCLDPSGEDREVTDRLERAGKLLGIPLLDHLVVSGSDWESIGGLS